MLAMAAGRLCVVGDVHGHLAELRRALQAAALIDACGDWTGGTACLAVLGDLMDRGPDGVGVLDLLMRLQWQAEAAGGKAVTLLGNHEVLFVGARRFGYEPTETRGGSFLQDWQRLGGTQSDMDTCTDAHAAWLESLPAMTLAHDHLLVHADSLFYMDLGATVDAVNARVRDLMRTSDRAELLEFLRLFSARHAFHGADGLHYLDQFLEQFGGNRVVHGHTPIARVAEQPPESVNGPLIYADGRCVNVDPGLYLGGSGFVYEATL
jgi:hypothetical protein